MRLGFKTSFMSILCVLATAGAYAATSVRTIGGDGTYDSAALAAVAATDIDDATRAGSLRAVGMVRPTTSQPTAATGSTVTTATTDAGAGSALKKASVSTSKTPTVGRGTVTVGGMPRATTSVGRVAAGPRLSIGQYIGAGKNMSISSQSGAAISNDLMNRIDALEQNVDNLSAEKQNVISNGEFVYIDDASGELVLDTERLKNALELAAGSDGREVKLGHDDNGLLWRYAGETEWQPLISYDAIRGPQGPQGLKGDKGEPGEPGATTAQMNAAILDAVNTVWTDVQGVLDTKVDKAWGQQHAGKVLVVNQFGNVDLDEVPTLSTLGALATKDEVESADIKDNTIKNADVADDAAIERRKLANDVIESLNRADEWLTDYPSDGRHVLGVVDGNKQWMQVVVPDEVQY